MVFVFGFILDAVAGNYVTIENTNSNPRENPVVELSLAKMGINTENAYWYVKDEKGNIYPAQRTYDGKLIFEAGRIGSHDQMRYEVCQGKVHGTAEKVEGRFYPERAGDLAFENDQVGFRLYGKELIKTDGPSNGIDLWLKRTKNMVLESWYYNALHYGISFHTDHGEGCDPYNVGHSLGAGAMAPFINGKVILNSNFESGKILDNGPLRFTVELIYPEMEINGKKCSERRIVSLDAGSRLLKVTEVYGFEGNFPVVAGIIKRNELGDTIIWDKGKDYFIYGEPRTKENGQIYIGVYLPGGLKNVFENSYKYDNDVKKEEQHYTQILGLSNYKAGQPLVYYVGYGWDKGDMKSVEDFSLYMQAYRERKINPLLVKY